MATLGQRADGLKRVLRNGGDFDDLIAAASGDPDRRAQEVSMTSSPRVAWSSLLKTSASTNPLVRSVGLKPTYGVHLIEVLDRRTKVEEARVAFITKEVAASAATARDAYAMASEFAINATDKESLMAAAKEAGMRRVKPTASHPLQGASPG